ncbi:unnamed protein product [Timema podura]|uniref:Uncharacterized protein n=1 Tax=Timema podura TaxID=61482 RepID=A0ABN7PKZ9_TIMPD|nr:unnamed protein product [Timema podura]
MAGHKKVCMRQHPQLTGETACQSPEEHIDIMARHKKGCLKELEHWIKQESLVPRGYRNRDRGLPGQSVMVVCTLFTLNGSKSILAGYTKEGP